MDAGCGGFSFNPLHADVLRDSREPYIKHDELVALQFLDPDGKKSLGIVVQWNCHPETVDSKSTELTADYVATTVTLFIVPVLYSIFVLDLKIIRWEESVANADAPCEGAALRVETTAEEASP